MKVKAKKLVAGILAAAMTFTGLYIQNEKPVKVLAAESTKAEVRDVNLNINNDIAGITDPTSTNPDTATAWTGSKFYYAGMVFRVLDAKTKVYNDDVTMFVQADNTVAVKSQSNRSSYLSGAFFDSFSSIESSVVKESTKLTLDAGEKEPVEDWFYQKIDKEKAFLLDGAEVSNVNYGYSNAATRKMSGEYLVWWLRNGKSSGDALINSDGSYGSMFHNTNYGISPAMNLDLSKILFSCASYSDLEKNSSFGTVSSEKTDTNLWKFTLTSDDKTFAVNDVPVSMKAGESATVKVTNAGTGEYTQTSALLADENGTVVAYGKIGDATVGSKTLKLPSSLEDGVYQLYIFNEQINNYKKSDVASNVVEKTLYVGVDAPTAEPTESIIPSAIPSENVDTSPSAIASAEPSIAPSEQNNINNINLNINNNIAGIADPTSTDPDTATKWTGSRIYYADMLFRVLDAKTKVYNSQASIFVQTDSTIENEDGVYEAYKKYLSGNYWNGFSDSEKDTVLQSTKLSLDYGEVEPVDKYVYAPIENEKVFLLDAVDISNPNFGYSNEDTRKMIGTSKIWLTRTGISQSGAYSAVIGEEGEYRWGWFGAYDTRGIAPAMNIDLSKIFFSCVSYSDLEKNNSFGIVLSDKVSTNLWKLTLKSDDTGFSVDSLPTNVKAGENVRIQVSNAGNGEYTQTSALLADENGVVVAYGSIGDAKAGTKNLKIPVSLEDGIYQLYVFNEQVNTYKKSDIASNIIEGTLYVGDVAPTAEPTNSPSPTTKPSSNPTAEASAAPTTEPSSSPSTEPSNMPSTEPSESAIPTASTKPTSAAMASSIPTEVPTETAAPGKNPANPPTSNYKSGDVDQSQGVDLSDVQIILQFYLDMRPIPNDEVRALADVNHDSIIDLRDVQMVLQAYLELITLDDLTIDQEINNTNQPIDASLTNPRVVTDSDMKSGQITTWDCIWFGNYPQSEITSADPIYKILESSTDWDDNGDIVINGSKYRRIQMSDSTEIQYNSNYDYYSWFDNDTYHYFLYEPIKWRVLNIEGNKALLLSDIALDDQQYHNTYTNVTWKESMYRSWLNGYSDNKYHMPNFYDTAFEQYEKEMIYESTIDSSDSKSMVYKDKIFALSQEEACNTNYGFSNEKASIDEGKLCKSSDYALALGVLRSKEKEYLGCCRWRLRTPGSGGANASYVDFRGEIIDGGLYDWYGTRPALNLDLSKTDTYSYAGIVRSDGKFASVQEYLEDEYVKSQIDSMSESMTDSGMTMEVRADGNKLVYSYSYTELVKQEGMAEKLENSLHSEEATFKSTAASLKDVIDITDPIVVVEYIDANGDLIYRHEYMAD